jgi:hypothetical protein
MHRDRIIAISNAGGQKGGTLYTFVTSVLSRVALGASEWGLFGAH